MSADLVDGKIQGVQSAVTDIKDGIEAGVEAKVGKVQGVLELIRDKAESKVSKLKGIFAQIRRAAASKVDSLKSKLQKREALPPAAVLARARGHGSSKVQRGQDNVAGIRARLSEKLDKIRGVFADYRLQKREAVEAVEANEAVNAAIAGIAKTHGLTEISEKSQKLREKFAKIKAEIDAKFEYVDAKLKTFFSRLQKEFESKFGSKL